MASTLFNYPKFKAFTSAGVPLSGGKVYTYISGSSTPRNTYADKDYVTANANPVILDSLGEAVIYLNGVYKIVLRDSSDNLIWTMDNVEGVPRSDPISTKGDLIQGGTGGILERIPVGTEGQLLRVNSTGQWEPYTVPPTVFKLDDLSPPDDNTDLDVSTAKHGLFPKLDGSASSVYSGAGTWVGVPPVGTGFLWFTNTAPSGFLLCRGQEVSRTTYATLFGVIGTTYGVGDGSTTFNLPDLQQRFPLGKAAAGTGSTLAGTGGAIDHTHDVPGTYAWTSGIMVSMVDPGYLITSGTENPPYLVVNYIIKY